MNGERGGENLLLPAEKWVVRTWAFLVLHLGGPSPVPLFWQMTLPNQSYQSSQDRFVGRCLFVPYLLDCQSCNLVIFIIDLVQK